MYPEPPLLVIKLITLAGSQLFTSQPCGSKVCLFHVHLLCLSQSMEHGRDPTNVER